jgi:hypothetical protein
MPRSKINKKSHGLVYECVRLTGVFFWQLVKEREREAARSFQVAIETSHRRPSGRRDGSWPEKNTTRAWGQLDGRNAALIAGGDFSDTQRLVAIAFQEKFVEEYEARAFFDLFKFLYQLDHERANFSGVASNACDVLCDVADLPADAAQRCRWAELLSGAKHPPQMPLAESHLQKIALRLVTCVYRLTSLLSIATEPFEVYQPRGWEDVAQFRHRETLFAEHRWLKALHKAWTEEHKERVATNVEAKNSLCNRGNEQMVNYNV